MPYIRNLVTRLIALQRLVRIEESPRNRSQNIDPSEKERNGPPRHTVILHEPGDGNRREAIERSDCVHDREDDGRIAKADLDRRRVGTWTRYAREKRPRRHE